MTTILIFSHLFCLALGSALTLIGMRALRSVAVVVEAPPSGFDSDPMMDVDAEEVEFDNTSTGLSAVVPPEDIAAFADYWRRYARVGDTGPERIALRTVARGTGGTIAAQGIALPNSGYPLSDQEVEAMLADCFAPPYAEENAVTGALNHPRTDTGD